MFVDLVHQPSIDSNEQLLLMYKLEIMSEISTGIVELLRGQMSGKKLRNAEPHSLM